MKNTVKLLVISLVVILIANCKKKDTSPDLTTNIVGTYTGTYHDSITGFGPGYSSYYDSTFKSQVQITKLSNTTVYVQPSDNDSIDASPFIATLSYSVTGDTIVLATPSTQYFQGGSSQLYTLPPPPTPQTSFPDTSEFVIKSGQLNYNLQVVNNGLSATQQFIGTKQ